MDKLNEQVQEQFLEYERPTVVDYGTLVELTASGNVLNKDVPGGNTNTANVS
jgi:hypothetical protein